MSIEHSIALEITYNFVIEIHMKIVFFSIWKLFGRKKISIDLLLNVYDIKIDKYSIGL